MWISPSSQISRVSLLTTKQIAHHGCVWVGGCAFPKVSSYVIDDFIPSKYFTVFTCLQPWPKITSMWIQKQKKNSGTCKLQVSENDSTVLHSTLTCFLLFSQDFSHKVVCFAYEENNQILFVAKQVLIAHLNLKEIFPNISKFL